jgi:hypothetical protein
MKEPCFLAGIRNCGGWSVAPTTTVTGLFSGQGASSSPCYADIRTLLAGRGRGIMPPSIGAWLSPARAHGSGP